MRRWLLSSALALAGIATVAWLTSAFLPALGLASAALLFLLPVLATAARAGPGPAVFAAVAAAAAYNFFLLPPRFTFAVHGIANLVSLVVLLAVALVTSRLATRLRAREAEALDQAGRSAELAELAAILSGPPAATAAARGIEWLGARHGAIALVDSRGLAAPSGEFTSLDLAAAAWALHNGDTTGHGTDIMPAAEWSFFPLGPANAEDGAVAAIARPADGTTRSATRLEHLAAACRLVGQARDREALEAERRARELLAEGDRLRRTMLAALAHDLRTPLTVLTGRLALIAGQSADGAEALAAAQRLERMMRDLLGAARLEAGTLQPRMERIDLVDALASAVEAVQPPAGVALESKVDATVPLVPADPILLQHVLANLLDNALRHARSRVKIAAEPGGEQVMVTVDDDGPGIPEADRPGLFDRFRRQDATDRADGSGLGLAIVKGFADAMGMTVRASEAADGGARFELLIPTRPETRA